MPHQCHTSSHIIDSHFFAGAYSTEESRKVFCDYRRMQRWLDVEVALVKCQAELGIIPKDAAKAIIDTAHLEHLDISTIKADIASTGHSLIPLLREWQRVTASAAGQYIHYGATTQDIQDTAQSLELKDITAILTRDLEEIINILSVQADRNRDIVTVGRSHGQHALPTTIGLKMVSWLDEALRNHTRLVNCKERLLVAQLFGGVGTMAALSSQGVALLDQFAETLGLSAPLSCWHASRDRIAEFISVLAIVTGGLARIANEICQLARNEIGELAEPFVYGQIGSTTMPHKKNPELCEQVVVLARLVKGNATTAFDTLCNEHERDYRAVRLEWVALTEASIFSCATTHLIKSILQGLVVNTKKIKENLNRFAVLVSTEALMFLLGDKIGKQSAHALIYKASVIDSGPDQTDLIDRLLATPEISRHFNRATLAEAIDPERHIGLSSTIIDRVRAEAEKILPPRQIGPSPCTTILNGICCCHQGT